ncbi:hypothetical protein BOKEGFJH_00214 [Chlamydia avium]|uniref:DNA-directed DNA polymerase n=2 Tax=Chlamydia avium TaxID=1457141 RepID=W8JEU0_9CHLA|nr:hypothetical protein [Chlamydia avium]AHK63091.1 Uncharacterized protein M832_02220 [Chlamydia avium 10DC88]EPP37498.1 hypothetical protein CP10743SC13_0542 [Chlamydia psittaci 10_743_SC13]EPP38333.1 hypothetical protein CP10881SC42_0627 [Chlamydia avium]VVT42703.1 hypothetical protein BOKEGFJH_00214 [Chlamydia avium]
MQSYTNFQDFNKLFKEQSPSFAVIGSNSEEDKDICMELLVSGKMREFDALGLTVNDLSQWTESYGLFAFLETIVIYRVEKLSQSVRDFFIRYSNNPHPYLTFVLFTTKQSYFQGLQKDLPTAMFLSLFGEWFSDREKRITALLTQKASSLGISCSSALASAFVKKFPQREIHYLLGEFHKLLCQIGDKKVLEYKDIESLVEKQEQVSLWKFRDALLQRNVRESQALLHSLLYEHGEDPLSLIAFLRGQCLYGLRGLEEKNKDHRYRIFFVYGKEHLYQALSHLFYVESLIKNNIQDPLIGMETLLVRMACL